MQLTPRQSPLDNAYTGYKAAVQEERVWAKFVPPRIPSVSDDRRSIVSLMK